MSLPRSTRPQQDVRNLAQRNDWKPRNCVWELTLACNLRCKHCGSSAGKPRPRELTTEECIRVVDELAAAGCELLTLSGGEPTLRPDWHVIAASAVQRGMTVNMVTNGVTSSAGSAAEIVARARAAGMCNLGISIDGARDVHDAIRGPGRLDATLALARESVRGGLPVSFMTTVNRLNVHRLSEMHRLAVDSGAGMWRLQLAKPMGNLELDDSLVLRPRDLLALLPWLASLAETSPIEVRVGDSIGYYGDCDKVLRGKGWRGARPESWHGCQAGMQAIGIQSDGTVKGCLSLQAKVAGRDPFIEGSLLESSLEEIWLRPGAFAFNRNAGVDQLTGFCRRCEHAARCRGGARCVSSAFLGVLTEDPYCFHRVTRLDGEARRRGRSLRVSAATAVALAFCTAGCGGSVEAANGAASDSDAGTDALPAADAAVDHVAFDAPSDAIDCSNVCCLCDYGVIPTDVEEACCGDGAALPDSAPADAPVADVLPPDAPDDVAPDAIDCSAICCMCDYGVIPPGAWEACCVDAGTTVDAAPDAPPDAVDCTNVCCDCDYGAIPPAECCTDN